ncbi:hypothetical protein BV25DRAFT_705951 [Artomyces pyxidatus]|uniref:Uncharacterized protein n=1 Tax=Artomyces pyxidatus TaxID=48021 RepID=A0ACB8SZD6_9AGAM|nr:hypothetical protein BV25DRAFT_705951 [Artomyces pyxidatus]
MHHILHINRDLAGSRRRSRNPRPARTLHAPAHPSTQGPAHASQRSVGPRECRLAHHRDMAARPSPRAAEAPRVRDHDAGVRASGLTRLLSSAVAEALRERKISRPQPLRPAVARPRPHLTRAASGRPAGKPHVRTARGSPKTKGVRFAEESPPRMDRYQCNLGIREFHGHFPVYIWDSGKAVRMT